MRVRDHSVLTSQPIPLFATMRPRAFVSTLLQTGVRMKKAELILAQLPYSEVAVGDH
jgi:hypothetical protein